LKTVALFKLLSSHHTAGLASD